MILYRMSICLRPFLPLPNHSRLAVPRVTSLFSVTFALSKILEKECRLTPLFSSNRFAFFILAEISPVFATHTKNEGGRGSLFYLLRQRRFCSQIGRPPMPAVEIPRAQQQAAPEIDARLQRYLGRNQHQHQPIQEPENTQHNLRCRGNLLLAENAHRRKQDRRQQHNFIRK